MINLNGPEPKERTKYRQCASEALIMRFLSARLSLVVAGIAISGALGCTTKSGHQAAKSSADKTLVKVSSDLVELKNNDVLWSGTYIGVEPQLRGPAVPVLKRIAEEHKVGRHETRDRLVDLMSDPERFIVAHVLLTKSMYERKYTIDGSRWNGLEVHVLNGGAVQIDSHQRVDLEAKWENESETRRVEHTTLGTQIPAHGLYGPVDLGVRQADSTTP